MDIQKLGDRSFAWEIDNVKLIQPLPVKGKLHLFEVEDALIKPATMNGINLNDDGVSDQLIDEWIDRYYEPLYV